MHFLLSLLLTVVFFIAALPWFKNWLTDASLFLDDGYMTYIEFFYFFAFFVALNFIANLCLHAFYSGKFRPRVKDVSYKVFEDDRVKQVRVDIVEQERSNLSPNAGNMADILSDVHEEDATAGASAGASIEQKIRKKHH